MKFTDGFKRFNDLNKQIIKYKMNIHFLSRFYAIKEGWKRGIFLALSCEHVRNQFNFRLIRIQRINPFHEDTFTWSRRKDKLSKQLITRDAGRNKW